MYFLSRTAVMFIALALVLLMAACQGTSSSPTDNGEPSPTPAETQTRGNEPTATPESAATRVPDPTPTTAPDWTQQNNQSNLEFLRTAVTLETSADRVYSADFGANGPTVTLTIGTCCPYIKIGDIKGEATAQRSQSDSITEDLDLRFEWDLDGAICVDCTDLSQITVRFPGPGIYQPRATIAIPHVLEVSGSISKDASTSQWAYIGMESRVIRVYGLAQKARHEIAMNAIRNMKAIAAPGGSGGGSGGAVYLGLAYIGQAQVHGGPHELVLAQSDDFDPKFETLAVDRSDGLLTGLDVATLNGDATARYAGAGLAPARIALLSYYDAAMGAIKVSEIKMEIETIEYRDGESPSSSSSLVGGARAVIVDRVGKVTEDMQTSLAIGDLDGDGLLDIAVAYTGEKGTVRLAVLPGSAGSSEPDAWQRLTIDGIGDPMEGFTKLHVVETDQGPGLALIGTVGGHGDEAGVLKGIIGAPDGTAADGAAVRYHDWRWTAYRLAGGDGDPEVAGAMDSILLPDGRLAVAYTACQRSNDPDAACGDSVVKLVTTKASYNGLMGIGHPPTSPEDWTARVTLFKEDGTPIRAAAGGGLSLVDLVGGLGITYVDEDTSGSTFAYASNIGIEKITMAAERALQLERVSGEDDLSGAWTIISLGQADIQPRLRSGFIHATSHHGQLFIVTPQQTNQGGVSRWTLQVRVARIEMA